MTEMCLCSGVTALYCVAVGTAITLYIHKMRLICLVMLKILGRKRTTGRHLTSNRKLAFIVHKSASLMLITDSMKICLAFTDRGRWGGKEQRKKKNWRNCSLSAVGAMGVVSKCNPVSWSWTCGCRSLSGTHGRREVMQCVWADLSSNSNVLEHWMFRQKDFLSVLVEFTNCRDAMTPVRLQQNHEKTW